MITNMVFITSAHNEKCVLGSISDKSVTISDCSITFKNYIQVTFLYEISYYYIKIRVFWDMMPSDLKRQYSCYNFSILNAQNSPLLSWIAWQNHCVMSYSPKNCNQQLHLIFSNMNIFHTSWKLKCNKYLCKLALTWDTNI